MVRRLAAVGLVCAAACVCGAQPTAPPLASPATLGDVLASARRAAVITDFRQRAPAASATLDSVVAVLELLHANGLTVAQLADSIQASPPRLATVARWGGTGERIGARYRLVSALFALEGIVNTPVTDELIRQQVPKVTRDSLLAPVDALGAATLAASMQKNAEKLRRFEIKYGPDSPRLNGAEVLLNYVAQFVPLFQSGDAGPSPLEIVASYSTADATLTQKDGKWKGSAVSDARLGVRRYQFQSGWGTGGTMARFLKPATIAAGVFVMGPRDGPLVAPWESGNRVGGFLSWGGLHLGAVGGSQGRVVIGSGKQFIPYLF
jgi:hypothetical protein